MNVNNGVLGYHLFASDISALQCHTSKYVSFRCSIVFYINVKEIQILCFHQSQNRRVIAHRTVAKSARNILLVSGRSGLMIPTTIPADG